MLNMKGENTLKVLEFIEEIAQSIGDIFFIFTLPYGTPYNKMKYLSEQRHKLTDKEAFGRADKARFRDLLYRLRRDGLVEEVKKGQRRLLGLTVRGRIKIEKLRLLVGKSLPPTKYEYEDGNRSKIIIFDIPEKEKRKRQWLRVVLKNLGFTMLQKSVWTGKAKLPQQFLSDLNRIKLVDYIEIFEISRAGSLRNLKA